MSIASEITRLQTAKADIKTAIEAKGVTVPSNATLDTYDDYVAQISGGGGGDKLVSVIGRTVTGLTSSDLSGATSIGNYALCDSRNLVSVQIPSSVTTIGDYAFCGCTNMVSVQIPSSVITIGAYAFQRCKKVEDITVSSSTINFGNYCFNELGTETISGTNVTIKPKISSTVSSMFRSAKLRNLVFEGGLDYTGSYMLYKTSADTLTICGGALSGGSSSSSNFLNTAVGTSKTDCKLAEIIITSGQTQIGKYCFYSGLSITSINMSAATDTTSIRQNAFDTCSAMTTCILPPNVTTIDTSAFRNCRSLTAVTVPSSVTSVGATCFSGSSALTYVRFTSTTPPTLGGSGVFAGTNTCPIYVPSGSVDTYKTADVWSGWADRIQAWTGGD